MRAGRQNIRWNTGVQDGNGKTVFIEIGRAAEYLTGEFWQCYGVYIMSENMGCLPFAGGWAEQPEWITLAINLFKVESSLWEKKEFEARRREHDKNKKYS